MKKLTIILIFIFFSSVSKAQFIFPKDHGPHNARTEWWYFAGNLIKGEKVTFGYELSIFKITLLGKSQFFADIAINDNARDSFGSKRIISFKPQVKKDGIYLDLGKNASAISYSKGQLHLEGMVKNHGHFSLDLDMESSSLIPINRTGYIEYGQGAGSFYYTMPRIKTAGEITIKRAGMSSTHFVTGNSWFDHQWGNFVPGFYPTNMKKSWWLSGQLNSGMNVNFFQTFDGKGKSIMGRGLIEYPNGNIMHLKLGEYKITPLRTWKSPNTKYEYGIEWKVVVKKTNEAFLFKTHIENQEFLNKYNFGKSYYEGRGQVTYTDDTGKESLGLGLIETLNF